MKKLHWSWEHAYKKLFFLRFFLLLVVLCLAIALAYITFHSANQYENYIDQQPVHHINTQVNDGTDSFNVSRHNVQKDVALITQAKPDTTSWKTYTSSTYGFSFKYPGVDILTETDHGLYIEANVPDNSPEAGHYLNVAFCNKENGDCPQSGVEEDAGQELSMAISTTTYPIAINGYKTFVSDMVGDGYYIIPITTSNNFYMLGYEVAGSNKDTISRTSAGIISTFTFK